ncbi:MAG: hypothetical protein ACREQW_02945 [Candidatus Binatia bacterium]
MKSFSHKLIVAATLLLALLFLACLSIYLFIRSESGRVRIESELSQRTGYEVRIDDLWLTPALRIVAAGIVVSKEGQTLLQAKKIVAVILPFDFLSGRISGLSLESPVLHLSLKDFFEPSAKTEPKVSISALNIEDGRFVLETGYGEDLALQSIFLSAKNVNLGGETGLQLRAHVPALKGDAVVSLSVGPEARQAEILIDQEDKSWAALSSKDKEKGTLEARFQMKPGAKDTYQITGSGSANEFQMGSERINGGFNSLIEIDGKLQEALLSLDLSAEGDKFSFSQLSLKLPFQWADSSFRIKAGRFQGKNLNWGRSGETQWTFQEAGLVGDVVKAQEKPLQMSADFHIVDGRFSTPELSKVGEGLAAKGRLTYTDRNGVASFRGEARIESLELLWNSFFGDFGQQKPSIVVDGSYQRDADDLKFEKLRVALDSIGRLDFKGWVHHLLGDPVFDLDVRADNLSAAGFYNFFIREPFKINYPFLAQTQIAGRSDFAVHAEGTPKAFALEGNLRLQDVRIQEQSGRWNIGPVALDLPFKVRFPQALSEKAAVVPRAGKLVISEVKTATTVLPKISTMPFLWNNFLGFTQPIRVSLFGGTGTIEGLAWRDIIGAPRDVSFSLKLDSLRLLELTEALGWHRFGGTLSGSIPEVRWVEESLRTDGRIILDVFGGRITVQAMEIERPLSRIPSIKMDAALEGLDLEQASKTFEFGQISGVLSGTINDLVLTEGQPGQFRADIHTVERQGVSQWISVEALNKITVISSGNEAGAIYGGVAGFFDFFRYSKLGFKATLKNDKLLLRGIESRDGKEYLVVGTLLPPTVNIISHTQEIAFSELLRRLERIQKNEASR